MANLTIPQKMEHNDVQMLNLVVAKSFPFSNVSVHETDDPVYSFCVIHRYIDWSGDATTTKAYFRTLRHALNNYTEQVINETKRNKEN